MKILHCGNYGSTFALVRTLRELGYEVDIVEYVHTYLNLPHDFSLGLRSPNPSPKDVLKFYVINTLNGNFKRMLTRYDVYHIHHCAFILPRQFGIDLQLLKAIPTKRIVIHYHGHDIFKYNHHKSLWSRGITKVVSTPNLLEYDEDNELKYIPNGVDFKEVKNFKKRYQKLKSRKNNVPVIIHSATHREWKGTEGILKVIEELKREGYEFEFILNEKVSQTTVWKSYIIGDIVIDQIYPPIGWFGFASLEAAAFKNATLCYIKPSLRKYLRGKGLIIIENFNDLKEKLKMMLTSKKALNKAKRKSYKWVKNYDIRKIAKEWVNIYENI